MKTRVHSPNLVHILFIIALAIPLAMGGLFPARASALGDPAASLQPASRVYAAEPQTGIDCGCTLTGWYEDPAAPLPLATQQPEYSPRGKYQVVWQYGSGQITSLSVIRVSDSREIVWLGALPNSTYWRFSPDDDRFAIYSIGTTISGSETSYYLYNLVKATGPGVPVWSTITSLVNTEAAFSLHGQYFQYAEGGSGTTYLTIRDARTGARAYETSFTAAPPPSGSKTRVASWGYSPDTSDRTFVYAYVNSQIVSSVYWGVVNLHLTTNTPVHDELLVNALSSQTIQPFWKFSPCGDAIGLVNTAVTPTNIRLFATSDGTFKGEQNITTGDTLALRNNLASHYVDTGSGTTYTLADNTADAACSVVPGEPGLQALSVSPASVICGTGAQGTVTLSEPAPSGGAVVSLASDTSAAQVPSSIRVPYGNSSANFGITTSEVSTETTAYISAMLGSTTNTAALTVLPSPIASLTMSRYGIIAGATEIGTVTLRDPAPAGGAVVWLYASGSFWAPNLVQVPEGETTATFEVTAWFYVDSPQATLTATYLGASKTIDLTILRASSLAVTPAEVTGGTDAVTVTVDLPGPAPEGGVLFPLSGDPAGIVDLSPSMIIETGQITGSITAGTTAIDEDTDVTILAGMPDDLESPTAVVHVLATIPTALPGGPYLVLAGQPLTLTGTGTDPRGESLTFAWDLDFDETFETAGDTAAFTDTAGQNREVPIGFRACNTSGLCGTALTFVRVRNIGQVWVSGPEASQDIGMPNNEIGIPDGPTPALVEDFGQVIDVVGGAGFMAALRADGTVWTMGDNFFGQLGNPELSTGWVDGHRAASNVPVQAVISDVVAVASKGEHVMALKRDGTVWTWGSNQYLTLGNGTADGNPHPTPTQVENLSGVVAIAASGHGSFALTRKGEIYGWGYGANIFGRACDDTTFPCRITTIRQAVALQVTSSWAIVLKRDGTVWFWGGYDPVTMEDRLDPEQIEGLSGIAAISASGEKGSIDSTGDALLALKNDGTVWGFGNNANGQLGQDPWIPYPPYLSDYIGPVQIPGLAGTRALAAGEALQSALLQDGTVAGWGLVVHSCPEGCGEFWLPSPLAGLANVLAVAVGDDFRLAIVPGVPGVPGAPGLAITQVADHETVSTGDEISFTITITNNGDDTARGVTLSDTLPLATELSWLVDGTDAASCTIAAGIVSCSFGDMPTGAVKTIRLTSPTQFIPGISGKGFCPTISSTATVMASNQPEGSSATASTEVLCPYVITSIWPDTPSVAAGDPVSFTITTGNMGEGIARGVLAETWLPENPGLGWSISDVVPASAAGNCGFSSGPDLELICDFPELAPSQEVTITVTSPTSFGSCGELRSGGTVTYSNGAETKSKVATIIVNSTSCTASDTVQPGEAATLTLPNGRGQIEFPANLVTAPTTFTYAEQDAPSQALGSYTFAGLSFTLVATDPDGNPVTSFGASYTMRLTYQDSDWQSAGVADESLLNLAYWNTVNGQWMNVLPCEGCSLDTEQNQLVAMLNHLTEFALLASTDTTPVITAQPQTQTADVGDTVSFSAAASGDPAPTVQWQVSTDDGTTWSNITGETASPLTFSASLDQNGNQYRAVFANSAGSATSDAATLTVSTKSASITLSNLTQTYDGQPKPVTVTTDPAGLSVAVTYDGSPSAPTHAGSYPVVATIDDGTYQGSASGTLTIQPKAASVTPDAAGKVYGDADPALTGTLAGFLATDGVTAACSRTAGEAVGDYSVSAVLSPAEVLANYDITYDSAAFTITPRPIQATADAKTKVAGEPDPLLTYQITGGSLAFSDAFSGALTRDPGDEVGVYAIQQGTLALSSNYTLTYVGADLTIVAASLNTAPVANPAGPYLGAINTAISFDGSGSSDADGDPVTYAWTFGDGGTATGATPTHSYAAAGVYDACLTVNDGTVDSSPACALAVVYDPSAGFVTGGGWIDSSAGAYKLDESLSGKATFGFVSKYKKGASVPEGNTEFQFQAGDLNFHSATYEWLVVAGKSRAQFKGSGTVNGELDPNGNAYKFMLWAGDGEPDTFRIRIWWEGADAVEHDVYDNGFDQPIGGGSIVVHANK